MDLKIFLLFFIYICLSQGKQEFLSNETWTTHTTTSPTALPTSPHLCYGNILLCTQGFTISLWIKPSLPFPDHDDVTIVTLGGTSGVSEGYYLERKHGVAWVGGVMIGDKKWEAEFNLLVGASWTHVALGWSRDDGVVVYVDGLMAGQSTQPANRKFWKTEYNYQPYLTIGSNVLHFSFKNIAIFDQKLSNQELYDVFGADSSQLILQCSKPTSATSHFTTSASAISFSQCQQHCFQNSLNLFLLKPSISCECLDFASFLTTPSLNQACSSDQFTLSWASHHHISFNPLLTTTLLLTPQKAIYNISQHVTFHINIQHNDDHVTFLVDFGDGSTLHTSDPSFSHAWTTEGTYNVKIIASNYFLSKTVTSEIRIEMISKSRPPTGVALQGWSQTEVGGVEFQVHAFSPERKECLLQLGEREVRYEEEGSLLKEEGSHVFGNVGFYNSSLKCSNQFGSEILNRIMVARDSHVTTAMLNFSSQATETFQVSNFLNNGRVEIDSTSVPSSQLQISPSSFSLKHGAFKTRGTHLLEAKSLENMAVFGRIYNLILPLRLPSIVAEKTHVSTNESLALSITVPQGDQVYVEISCGNGGSSHHFIPFTSTPITLSTSCVYSSLGKYQVEVVAVNEVSEVRVVEEVVVERKVSGAELQVEDTLELGTYTVFDFHVDQHKTPAPFLTFDIDYGNGETAQVELQPINSITPIYRHQYVYPQYGIYIIKSQVSNNLGSKALTDVALQVGQNITSVDLYVEKSDVMVGGEVWIRVKCPRGSPVSMQFTMGDGTTIQYLRPSTYLPTDDYDSSKPAPSRTPKSPTPGYFDDVIIKHTYNRSGLFPVQVHVTNLFSSTSTKLCPSINVVPPSSFQCTSLHVTATNTSSLDSPIVSNRSQPIYLAASSQLQCSQASPWYVWRAEKLVEGAWKPELQVCESGNPNNVLTIPPNTLWYGTYRMDVSIIATKGGVPSTSHSSHQSIFLEVISTPLVAIITSDKDNFYSNFDLIRLNLSKSHDPDVISGNITGMSYTVVCTYAKGSSVVTLERIQSEGVKVASNNQIKGSMYQMPSEPCFKAKASIDFNKDLTIGFLGSEVEVSDALRFTLIVTKDERESESSVEFSVLMTNLSASPLDSIDALLSNGDTGAALQILDLVTNGLSTSDDADASGERTKVRGKIISCLNKVSDNLHDSDQLTKTTKVMSDVTSNPDEVTSNAKGDAAKGLNNAAGKASGLTGSASKEQVQDITLSVLATAGQILPFAPSNTTSNSTEEEVKARVKRALMDPDEHDNETESLTCCQKLKGLCEWVEEIPKQEGNETLTYDLIDLKLTNWTDAECELIYPCDLTPIQKRYQAYLDAIDAADKALKESTTTNGMGAVGTIGGLLMGKQKKGEKVSMSTPGMDMTVASLDDEDSAPDGFDIPKGMGCGAMALNSGNPFTYSSEASDVSGNVKTLVMTQCDGTPLKIENSSQPFVIWMDGSPDEPTYDDFKLVHISTSSSFNYHPIHLEYNHTSIFASFIPAKHDSYNVYIKHQGFPNSTFYDWSTVIPPSTNTTPFSVFFPPDVTALNGTYRIGISLNSSQGIDVHDDDKNVTYAMTSFTSSCKYWNETTKKWASDGCTVGAKTTFRKTQCLCTHLTSFGGSFAVAPNTIDFSTVFSMENFLESLPVFGTVIAMIIIYILVLVWARRKDKQDIAKWGAVPLEDNLPTENYYYQVVVSTGMRKNSGTRSKPSFILSGDEADTGVRLLTDGKRKEIGTGSINNYILSVDKCLGPLTFLRIWHDNSGSGSKKGWFLDQVEVLDIQTCERFFFVCNQWLAVEEGDGQVERVIPVAGKDDMTQFGQLFTHSIRKKFSNDHLWFSIFSRPTKSSFSRVQRVSCCVSLLFMTMIVNCMFFKSTDPDHTTSVHIGPIEITLQQLFISVVSTLIIMPPSVAIITIFKKTRPKQNTVQLTNVSKAQGSGWKSIEKESEMWMENNRTKKQKLKEAVDNIAQFYKKPKNTEDIEDLEGQQKVKKKKKSAYLFPWWTIYIGWTLVFFTIVAPGFFTILYSMQWGREKSLDWLKTFFLSFFQSVIVVQPVKVLLITAFISCILKKPDIEEEADDINVIQNDDGDQHKKNVRAIMRQRQQAMGTAGVLDHTRLKELREKRLKEIQIEAILKECLIYIFFILVLYFISYQDKDNRSFTFVQNLQNQYFSTSGLKFEKISTYDDVYTWINHTLMAQLYTGGWYNGEGPSNWKEALQTSDHVTIRLGVARIRQLRIKEESCKIEKNFKKIVKHCRNNYNWMDDETKSFTKGWKEKLTKKEAKVEKKKDKDKHNPWLYRDSVELKSAPYLGKVNTYKGGGYVFNFYCNPEKTLSKLQELKDNGWLDTQTRAVIVEFTVYNANANLFGSVIMLQEFLATGVPVPSQEVKVFRVSSYVGPFGIIVILFQFIFVCFVIYFLVHSINAIRKQKKDYFKSFWNLLELLTVFMSVITVAMYAMKMIFGSTAMTVLEETGMGDYVNFVTIGLWAETYGIMLAIVVFLATIKFINMLKFNRRLSMLTETIKYSVKDMRAFVVTFFIYLFAFIQLAYLLFATKLDSFRSVARVTETLLQFFIGAFDYQDYTLAQPILGPIYFFMFVWAIIFGMQTMFLVIIIEAFQAVRKENEFKKNDYEVGEYLWTRIKGMFGRD